jgi:hypothetical protein
MTIEEMKNLNKDDLIQFAKEFNIWKTYTFPEYVNMKEAIIQQMSKYGILIDEVQPERIIANINVITKYK